MATKTPNLGLTMPGLDNQADIAVLNQDYTLIDTAIWRNTTALASKKIKFYVFTNAESINIDLKYATSGFYPSTIIFINAYQNILSTSVASGTTIRNYGTNSINESLSGNTLTITAANGSTFWGVSLVILATSYTND